ncbi:MAG TPA: DUF2065 domain-containing protein [Burkholderiaceae bacterium]|nr:DUF2065 domain-containing protein [Burkholderiaceae bacterium]
MGSVQSWLTALGLVLVIEGLMPFVSPGAWRDTMQRLTRLRDGQIRFIGLAALIVGLLLISV